MNECKRGARAGETERKNQHKENETYSQNAIRSERVHAKTLSALHDLTPIAKRACASPQYPIRPEHGAEQCWRLETLGGVGTLEHFVRRARLYLTGCWHGRYM